MRICRKCSKQARDDSKICRNCGAILEDLQEEAVPGPQPESPPPSSSPSSGETQAAESGLNGGPSPGEVLLAPQEPAAADDRRKPAWKCPGCGESVPGTFDVCWKCLTTKDGEKADQKELEFLQKVADTDEPNQEPAEGSDDALETEEVEEEQIVLTECPRCGSAKMMRGVTIYDYDQGRYSHGRLTVVVLGNPGAMIFQDRLYGEVKADICGRCGHIELRVVNPSELYRHYRKSAE
jgi:ribosomal protein S27AE